MTPSPPLYRSGFEIALICALKIEFDAVHAVFDHFWEDDEQKHYGQALGDNNVYTVGAIGEHNVVLAYLPGMGKVNASAVSVGLQISFPSIKLVVVAGVCGAVPYGIDDQNTIYLGDLVISTALVQYDFGRQYPVVYERKNTLEDSLGRPSPRIRALLNKFQTERYRGRLQESLNTALKKIDAKFATMRYPGTEKDLLYEPAYVHQHRTSVTSDVCSLCSEADGQTCPTALTSTCIKIGCMKVARVRDQKNLERQEPYLSTVHFGKMGSGDTVMKSGLHRDSIAKKDGIIAFEMEGAGVWDRLPCVVLKGVCDYADSHKNKDWQPRAAAVAAAGVKAFLTELHPSSNLLAFDPDHVDKNCEESALTEYRESGRLNKESNHGEISQDDVLRLPSGKRPRTNRQANDLCDPDPVEGCDDGDDDKIAASLAFDQMFERKHDIEAQHRRTCRWILDLAEYRNWQSQESGLLWIKGKPGTGKSTLMLFLYNHLRRERTESRHGIHLDFFFSARGSNLQRTALGMLRSLLNQLLQQASGSRPLIREVYREKNAAFGGVSPSWTWSQRELEALFVEAILISAQQKQVTIFIDALDEAGEEAAREIAHYFHYINDQISDASGRAKICISCRHYPISSRIHGIEVFVEDHNRRDIAAFVQDRLRIEDSDTSDYREDSWRSIATDVVRQANGIFQWVRLVVQILEKLLDDGAPLKLVRRRLLQVPKQLEEIYEHIVQKVIDCHDRSTSLALFQWLCLAEQPLSITQMRFALAAKDAVSSQPQVKCCETEGFVEEDELMKIQVRALSGGLAEVINSDIGGTERVQVIHQSVNDFFVSKGLAILMTSESRETAISVPLMGGLDPVRLSHEKLYRYCLNYLATENFSDYDPSSLSTHRYPFLSYAVFNLFHHARKSTGRRVWPVEEEVQLLDQVVDDLAAVRCAMNIYGDAVLCYAGSTSLHVAALHNLADVVRHYVSRGFNVNYPNRYGYTALHLAAWEGHLAIVELLYEAGSNIHTVTEDEKTPLISATVGGHLEVVKWLLQRVAGSKERSYELPRALYLAARGGSASLVACILEAGVDVNMQGSNPGTALQIATEQASQVIVQMPLNAGADVNAVNGGALWSAASGGYIDIVKLLLNAGADINAGNGCALWSAARGGYIDIVKLLLNAGADINAGDGGALWSAASGGYIDIVKLLLNAGADINAGDGGALWSAASGGYIDIVKLLLDVGSDINPGNGRALWSAARNGYIDIVKLLLDAGADINAGNGRALKLAAELARVDTVKILLDAGADPRMVDLQFTNPACIGLIQQALKNYGPSAE